jgi:hypothetical protein
MFGLGLLETKLIGGVALVALLVMGLAYWTDSLKQEGRAECQAAHDKADRIEEQRRTAALAGVANEAQRMANRVRADAAGVDRAAPGLRGAVSARLHVPAAASSASAPAGTAGDVLADVLGAAETRLRDMAALADQSRVAGSACERAYQALTP